MRLLFAVTVNGFTRAAQPLTKESDDVVSRISRATNAGPETTTFLIILALLNAHGQGRAIEVEQGVAHVQLGDHAHPQSADGAQTNNQHVSQVTERQTRSHEQALQVR
eukprot:3940040-Rhodomonas_salina.1